MGAEPDDDVLAVVAHGLLGPVLAIRTAALTLSRTGDVLPADVRADLLVQMHERCQLVSDLLVDLIRGASPDVQAALQELERHG